MTPALVLVDLQEDFLRAPGLDPCAGEVVAGATRLLEGCRGLGVPVIHVLTTVDPSGRDRMPHWQRTDRRWCVAGTPGHEPPAPLRPRTPGERVLPKTFFSAFGTGALEAALRADHVDTVVIAGVHLHACVRATVLDAYERGFEVVVADDAVASDDGLHAAITRRYLGERAARFLPTVRILDLLARRAPSALDRATGVTPATSAGVRAEGAPGTGPGAREVTPPGAGAAMSGAAVPALPGVLPASGGQTEALGDIVHVSPRDHRETLWRVPVAGAAEVARACAAARAAWPSWRDATVAARAGVLGALANVIEQERTRLARQLAVEIGKPLAQADGEVSRAVALLRTAAASAGAAEEGRGRQGTWRRAPPGVIAAVTPFNNPLEIPIGRIAPALLFGNTVVWKPAPAGAGIAVAVMELLERAGCPLGVVAMVCGDASTARSLAQDANVDAVTLTGSGAAGFALQEICARRGVPLQAELGGNNAAIVWEDGDVALAAREIAAGAFGFAGQRCTANRRVIVDARCFDRFVSALEAAVDALVWGDPLDPATQVGPLISTSARDRIEALLARAAAAGDMVRTSRAAFTGAAARAGVGPEDGAYHPPAVVFAGAPDREIVQDESFGPVLVVQTAADWDEALRLCNGVRQGLVAALFSGSPARQETFLRDVRCGLLKLNRATVGADVDLPFGGWKASGIGPPEHGPGNRELYGRLQAIYR